MHIAREDRAEQRKLPRFCLEHWVSSAGELVDISLTGARLRWKSFRRRPVPGRLKLETAKGTLDVPIRVVWTCRKGLRTREAGIAWEQLDDQTRKVLRFIAAHTDAKVFIDEDPSVAEARSFSRRILGR